jgi:hypothetical protein
MNEDSHLMQITRVAREIQSGLGWTRRRAIAAAIVLHREAIA